mgnify:CR=1 FL=1|tara:strand:+ start:303 stop:602 length:300 start_codon:yes stop_codon:yes gene_type:complete
MHKILTIILLLVSNIVFAAFPIFTEIMSVTSEENGSMFNFGGFILGLLVGIYGVIIAYLIKDKKVIKSSWWGFGVRVFLIVCIYTLIIFRFNMGTDFPL